MIKSGIVGFLALSTVILGLTLPGDPYRDPVPNSLKVAHSNHCAGCHGYDETGQALVDYSGHDVNIYDDWQISMMGLAAHDPFWRATLTHEVNLFPSAKEEIESTCLRCHSPLGSIQHRLDGLPYTYDMMLGDSLGLDGVSCSACHQQPADQLGKGHSGFFTVDTNRIFFGHYPNPFAGPMQIYVGFEPRFSDHIYSSGICAGCHTLITQTLDDTGTPSGDYFVEQATYHEWLNSTYPAQGKECQTCHMPFIDDGVVIATDLLALEERKPFGLHQFFGANTAMLSMMQEHQDELNLPKPSSEAAWTESIENNRTSLRRASAITLNSWSVADDTLYVSLSIQNKTGHKLPSGYPSRLAWLQLILTDHASADTLYANGLLDPDGHILGRDLPFEPHHEVSRSEGDVQIYELVMSDLHGTLTTRLNSAFEPLKDNRLLPLGFKTNHFTYDTVAIWGNALLDPDYGDESNKGTDQIEYRIPLQDNMGYGDLSISFHYQSLPARWMNDLFTNDTLAQVGQFKSMYENYKRSDEVMNEVTLEQIALSTSGVEDPALQHALAVFPNPVTHRTLHVTFSDYIQVPDEIPYRILSIDGRQWQEGVLSPTLILNREYPAGTYYLILSGTKGVLAIKPFTLL